MDKIEKLRNIWENIPRSIMEKIDLSEKEIINRYMDVFHFGDYFYSKGKAIEFPLSGVIKGWTEGLQLMNEGAIYRFIIPANLAYGNQSRPPHIKPGSTLVFEVELVQVK